MSMRGLRYIPDNTKINFMGIRGLAFSFSLIVVLLSFWATYSKGLNFGIDFTGGTSIEVRVPVNPDLQIIRESFGTLGLGAISIQTFGTDRDLLIRLPDQAKPKTWKDGDPEPNKAAIEKLRESLNSHFKDQTIEYRRIEFVGPQVGKELRRMGILAISLSLLGIMAYIWLRFEWQFGLAATLSLAAHDVIVIIGLFAITQMEFSLSTVAAILLVAGYSVNDTVVVFDRIREDLRKFKKKPLSEIINQSINETLSRTVMTSTTTVLALIALYIFGGEVIRSFVYALIFGIVIGTYSSIFVAAPLLIYFKMHRFLDSNTPTAETGKA